jgi:uracil-DNA glycosylase
MHTCNRCASFGLRFHRGYQPHEFIEGNRKARVWIVGLNPAQDLDWVDTRSVTGLVEYFDDESKVHGYFKQFKVVSEVLYRELGKEHGVAHTDLIKCSSNAWPPEGVSSRGRSEIIANCTMHLQRQLAEFKPQVIVCNGSEVSAEVKRLLPVPEGTPPNATSYTYCVDDWRVLVVLSGFIGRIDNYSKRRLGTEIEALLAQLQGES